MSVNINCDCVNYWQLINNLCYKIIAKSAILTLFALAITGWLFNFLPAAICVSTLIKWGDCLILTVAAVCAGSLLLALCGAGRLGYCYPFAK